MGHVSRALHVHRREVVRDLVEGNVLVLGDSK